MKNLTRLGTLEVWSEIFTGICCTVGFMGAAKNKNGMLKLLYECAPKSFMLNKVEENDHMVTREYYIQPTKVTQNTFHVYFITVAYIQSLGVIRQKKS